MKVIYTFNNKTERDRIISSVKSLDNGALLVEEQNHKDGNHLVFEVSKYDAYSNLRSESEIDLLKQRISALEAKAGIAGESK